MNNYPISIYNENGLLKIRASKDILGSQFDNMVQQLSFTRPPEYADHDLWLYCSNGEIRFSPVSLGQSNVFVVPNSATMNGKLFLEIGMISSSNENEHSNTLQIMMRPSIAQIDGIPQPWPTPFFDLMQTAFVDASATTTDYEFKNMNGDIVTSLPRNSGEGGGNVFSDQAQYLWVGSLADYEAQEKRNDTLYFIEG